VYEWVDLLPATPTPVTPVVAREVGDLLGRLHRLALPPARDEVSSWFVQPPRLEDWRDVARRGAEAEAPWMTWLPDEIDFLDDLCRRLAVPHRGPVITCHCDFAPGNVLPSAEDGSLIVLDWENAGALQADVELAWALVLWAVNGERVDADAAEALVEGYGARPAFAPTAFHTALVTHVNFLEVNLDQSLDPEQRGEFSDRWIDVLQPANLRERLIGIDRLAALFDHR
jgi:Ser/Thr protein kinase RdoA (MazF antagonist)